MQKPRETERGRAISLAKCRHGEGRRGAKTPEYLTWMSMIRRCRYPSQVFYPLYGGRGISVAEEWLGPGGFERFLEHVGRKPGPTHQLDRIDPDGNYEPGNVRWASTVEQQRNRRNNHMITANGRTLCIAEWAELTGINRLTILYRLKRGWSDERTINEPVRDMGRRRKESA